MGTTDPLLVIEEIAAKTRMPEASIRWKKQRGELPFIFRLGRRLVAYESEVDAWIAQQRQAQR
jgi:predicted DNA-binding transcriptional regulator AlpA